MRIPGPKLPPITVSNLAWLSLNDKERLSVNMQYFDVLKAYEKFSKEPTTNIVGATKIWFDELNQFNEKCMDAIEVLESMPDQEDDYVVKKMFKTKLFMQRMRQFTAALENTLKIDRRYMPVGR
jgi:hypothetical protein